MQVSVNSNLVNFGPTKLLICHFIATYVKYLVYYRTITKKKEESCVRYVRLTYKFSSQLLSLKLWLPTAGLSVNMYFFCMHRMSRQNSLNIKRAMNDGMFR